MDNQEQQSMEWVATQPKIEYKTIFNEFIGQLDNEVEEHLNNGWMPHGPQYAVDKKFYQALLRVPQQMMSRAL